MKLSVILISGRILCIIIACYKTTKLSKVGLEQCEKCSANAIVNKGSFILCGNMEDENDAQLTDQQIGILPVLVLGIMLFCLWFALSLDQA